MHYLKLWVVRGVIVVLAFSVLGCFGLEIYRQAPPIPRRDNIVIFTGDDIQNGQSVWQSFGDQEVGCIWGHGAYVAPDWSADRLHREALWLLDRWSQERYEKPYAQLDVEQRGAVTAHYSVENPCLEFFFLVAQCGRNIDGVIEFAANRPDANVGQCGTWGVVRPITAISAD